MVNDLKILEDDLFAGVDDGSVIWMSHGDYVTKMPKGFTVTAKLKTHLYVQYRIRKENLLECSFTWKLLIQNLGKNIR